MSIKKAIMKYLYASWGDVNSQIDLGEELKANSISDAITWMSLMNGSPCSDVSISTARNLLTIPGVQTNLVIKEDVDIPYKYIVSGTLEHIDNLQEYISSFDENSGYLLALWLKLPYACKYEMIPQLLAPGLTTTSGDDYLLQYIFNRSPNAGPDDPICPLYIGIRDSELVPSSFGISLDLEEPMTMIFKNGDDRDLAIKIDLSDLVFKDLPEDTEGSIVPDGEGDDSGGGK